MANINTYSKMSGRMMQEDGTVVNLADIFAPEPISSEQLTVDATAGGKALTAAKYGKAIKANIQVESAPVRVTVDGTPPTATYGRLINDGDEIELESAAEISKFRAFRTTAVSATLNIDYKG